MANYNIEICEILSKIIVVEADSEVIAKKNAIEAYKNAENGWILDADDCIERSLSIMRCKDEYEMFKKI